MSECEHEWRIDATYTMGGVDPFIRAEVRTCLVCDLTRYCDVPWVENRPFNWVGPIDAFAHLLEPARENINLMDE